MTLTFAVHSYRGGTGKTHLVSNLALLNALAGRKCCILDLDFRAPGLGPIFPAEEPKHYVNEFLDGDCEITDVVTKSLSGEADLLVGFADSRPEVIRQMMEKGKNWQANALRRLMTVPEKFAEIGVERIYLDTGPGVHYSSINAVASADVAMIVTRLDGSDIAGTKVLIESFYSILEKKSCIILNKVPEEEILADPKMVERLEKHFGMPILGAIPCFCDVLRGRGEAVFGLKHPDHPYMKVVGEISDKLEKMVGWA